MAQTRFQFGQRREFKNGLTDLIAKTADLSVCDLLCHRELAPTVRNEPAALLEWMKGQSSDGTKRVHVIIDWALTEKYNTPEIQEKYKNYQINRNASTLLSSPSRKLYEIFTQKEDDGGIPYLFQALKSFTTGPLAIEPQFAGHFSRIMEMLLMKDPNVASQMEWDFKSFIDFCLEHADINAYTDLISRIPVDYQGSITEEAFPRVKEHKPGSKRAGKEKESIEPITRYFMHVLQFAAKDVFTIESKLRRHEGEGKETLEQSMGRSLNFSRSMALRNRPKKAANPVGYDLKPLPDPEYLKMSYGEIVEKKDVIPDYEARVKKRRSRRGYSNSEGKDLELAKTRAYMIVNSVQIALDNDCSLSRWLQHRKVISLLLECGVYADDWSMVSIRTFRLLRKLLYGDEELEIADTFDQFKPVIEKYGKDFWFAEEVTPKMLAAFPIFWFCRYKRLSDPREEYPDITYTYIDVDEHVYEPRVYRKPEGKTPLEFYARLLLDEPAMSDQLNLEIWKILERLEAKRCAIEAQFQEKWKDPKNRMPELNVEFQNMVLEHDFTMMEFMRSQFEYQGEFTDIISCLLNSVPLGGFEDFYREVSDDKYHTTLNGVKLQVVKTLSKSSYGQWNCELTDLSFAVSHFNEELQRKLLLAYEGAMKKFVGGNVVICPSSSCERKEEKPDPQPSVSAPTKRRTWHTIPANVVVDQHGCPPDPNEIESYEQEQEEEEEQKQEPQEAGK